MSEPTPTTPHGPHPTVPGKLILLITAVGCVVLFFVVWATVRSVEKDLRDADRELRWAERSSWVMPAVIGMTMVKPNAANAQYTYDKPRYRDPGFDIEGEAERSAKDAADLADAPGFLDETTVQRLMNTRHEGAGFYTDYLLGVWLDKQGDQAASEDYFQEAFSHAPKVIAIRSLDNVGEPVADLELGPIRIGCDRVTDGGTRLDQTLVLAYPHQSTDSTGRVYLPVFDTTYRPVALPQTPGYEIDYDLSEGWFKLPSRLGSMIATVEPGTAQP